MKNHINKSYVLVMGFFVVISVVLLHTALSSAATVRSLSMANAQTALDGDLAAVWHNPAGIGSIEQRQAHFSYTLERGNSSNVDNFFAYAEPDEGFGAGVISLTMGKKLLGIDQGSGQGLYHTIQSWMYTVGKKVTEGTSLGVNLRYELHQDQILQDKGHAWRFDLGFIHELAPWAQVGVYVQNLLGTPIKWNESEDEPMMRKVLTGISFQPLSFITVAVDAENLLGEEKPIWHFGGEVEFIEGGFLRGGLIRKPDSTEYSLGLGITRDQWSFDYGFTIQDSSEPGIHHIATTLRF